MDRYKLITRSESYFSEGKYDKSIELANKAHKHVLSKKESTSPIYFMQYLYEKSNLKKENSFNKLYQTTINLAYCLQAKGIEVNQAESLYIEAINLVKKEFPNNPEYLLFPTVGCFKIYLARGDYFKSDSCYTELSKVLVNLNKYDEYYKAQSLVLYAAFAERNHAIEKAIYLRKEALETYRKRSSIRKGNYYISLLLSVSKDYININQLEKADENLKECDILLRKKKNQKIYRDYLIVVAQYLEMASDNSRAEKILLQLLELTLNTPGISELDIANAQYLVASHYFRTRKYLLANEFFNKSLNTARTIENEYPIAYNDFLFGSALSDFKVNKIASSLKKASRLESFYFNQFDKYFLFMPEEEKERFIEKLEKKINLLNYVRISVGDSSQIKNVFNNILAIKAVALESNRFIRNILFKENFSNMSHDFAVLTRRKEELELNRLTESLPIEYITHIEDSLRKIEIQMIKSIVENSDFTRFRVNSASWLNIRSSLKKGQVAIEFLNLPMDPIVQNKRTYYALIVKPESKFPALIKLCEESEIAKLILYTGSTKESINKIYNGNTFNKLYKLIWSPLNNYIRDAEKIYVSLSGILYQISLPVLTMEENYDIEILSNTRNLVFRENFAKSKSSGSAMLFGDIDYNNFAEITTNSILEISNKEIPENITRAGVRQLPGTKVEIDLIADVLEKNKFSFQRIIKEFATELSFRSMSNETVEIMHIATHGFYFPPDKSFEFDKFITGGFGRHSTFNNPLFRSGLLFAGANVQKHNSKRNDGILTSYEISKLNLSNTDLLVLSACETGLGDLRGGEGIYGLQRAFKLAGVESIIISLWKVPDEETSVLMQKFYENLITHQFDKKKSLKLAQQYLKENVKKEPFYWGAFEIIE
ncbi:MAG: CHAT domain-containing protein [Lentimicrobium sp.]